MSCSGHHFSVHSPDCKAHMSIQSNRPIQVEPLASNSRVSTPSQLAAAGSSRPATSNNQLQIMQQQQQRCGSSSSAAAEPMVRLVTPVDDPAADNNFTLVILDCSPHPGSPQATGAEHHYQQRRHLDAGYQDNQSEYAENCHCQTELIIRQQIEHDHSCRHHHGGASSATPTSSQYIQVLDSEQQEQWRQLTGSPATNTRSGKSRLENNETIESTTTSTTTRDTSTTRTDTEHANMLRKQQERENERESQFNQRQQQPESSEDPNQLMVQTRQQQRHVSHENFMQPNSGGGAAEQDPRLHQRDYQQQQQQHSVSPSQPTTSQQQRQRREITTTSTTSETRTSDERQQETRAPRPGTHLVKRWHWNRAEFVEEEVPDRPPPPPPTIVAPQGRAGRESRVGSAASPSAPQGDAWNQEIASYCAELSPVPPAAGRGLEPSWLEHRKPDEESVQADPLYRDLMFELQRLEEGVTREQAARRLAAAQQQAAASTPDYQQRPAFGQPLQPEAVELNEYENVEFIGRLIPNSGDPTMRVEWTKNGRPLLESSRLTCEYEFGVVRLAIRRCEAEDSGIYQCRAINALGEAHSRARLQVHAKGAVQYESLHPAGLARIRALENPPEVVHADEPQVAAAPKFLSHIQDYVEKDEGESVHFECCLGPVDDADMRTEWFFNGRPLVTGSRFHTIDDFGFIVLDIDWLFPRDTGEYICRASNKFGSDFTRTVLRVRPAKNIVLESQLAGDNPSATIDKLRQLEFPDARDEPFRDEQDTRPAHFVLPLGAARGRHYVEGDNVHFEARVGPATDGELTVDWLHNGRPLISGSRFKPTFDFGHILLDIFYLCPEDSGVYRCVARNAHGEDASEFEIQVAGKQSIVYQSQLPREMRGGVDKITEMEAAWNRAPDPEEDEAPTERMAPAFVLAPKPCAAFEGSCARFCCRIVAVPRARVSWFINGQLVVSGSRYKLTHDGMYHLIIPKCALSDAGSVEVRAKNLLGECSAGAELTVKRKVDDYRGVLKNSPNPWYDEHALKMYRRARLDSEAGADDEDFEEFLANFQKQRAQQQQQQQLKLATNRLAPGAGGGGGDASQVVVGYMEPGTPDVNLLLAGGQMSRAELFAPLVEPGDLHPVVLEQQAAKAAPPPSTIQRALLSKDKVVELPSSFVPEHVASVAQLATSGAGSQGPSPSTGEAQADGGSQGQQQQQRVFGLTRRNADQSANQQKRREQQHQQHQQRQAAKARADDESAPAQRQQSGMTQLSVGGAGRFPAASPENVEHGREIHSHFHTQLQVERHENKEITREIIEKETFEQEHSGLSKDKLSSLSADEQMERRERARSVTPTRFPRATAAAKFAGGPSEPSAHEPQPQVASADQQQQQQQQQQVLIEEFMVPPEFTRKIQPCQAIEGDDARFECSFKGEPRPVISWFRESRLLAPSNLYAIETDYDENKSSLVIRRVTLGGNAVYTVKAENAAGSAKSSANLVVEPHPLPVGSARGGHARQFDALEHLEQQQQQAQVSPGSIQMATSASQSARAAHFFSDARGFSPTISDYDDLSLATSLSSQDMHNLSQQQQKIIKSVRTRRMSPDEMTSLIRASPDNSLAPTFLHTIHEVHSRPGELARLDARLIGSAPMEVKWLRDGARVRPDKSHKLLLEGDLYTLLILECSHADEGFYECVASNAIGEARCGASLRVSAPDGRLSSVSQSSSQTATATTTYAGASGGATAMMHSISGQPLAQAQVAGNSSRISPNTTGSAATASSTKTTTTTTTTTSFTSQGSSSAATPAAGRQQVVPPSGGAQRQHFGQTKLPHHQLMSEYTSSQDSQTSAAASSSSSSSQQPGSGRQQQPAIPKLIRGLDNQQVREGQSVTLRCQISAFPKAEISWFKQDDKQIKPSKYFRIFKDNDETHCLKILETFPEDQGPYRCVARAQHGQVETSAFISVIPSSPK